MGEPGRFILENEMDLIKNSKAETLMIVRPKPLFPGARVALLAASSPVPPEKLESAVQSVRAMGLEPAVYPSCSLRHGYLAGHDAQRAADLTSAFADTNIDGILCIRGGYGAARILRRLDFASIARTPKYFGGYSDATALHTVFNTLCGFMTYHTPMPSTELYAELDSYTMWYLEQCLFGGRFGQLTNPESMPLEPVRGGSCAGTLAGGNLSLIAASLGTPWELDTAGKVLFLEEVDERPRKVDAMLTHLINAGKLGDCAGIILGAFTGCVAEKPEESLTLDEIFEELLSPLNIPVLKGLQCGHCLPTMSLPLGARVLLDADKRALTVLD